jgi:hypothetical protein
LRSKPVEFKRDGKPSLGEVRTDKFNSDGKPFMVEITTGRVKQ